MLTKYAVYDPSTGNNTIVETRDEAVQLFWQRMIEVALPYFHNTSYMTIEVNEETGMETWYNDSNNEIAKPKTQQEIIKMMMATQPENQIIENPTLVETMP